MNLNNVAELFISTVEKYPTRELYFYKKNDSWIGLTGEDIKITVTGIRPGEKLFEEIFHGSEAPVPSNIDGILIAKPRVPNMKKIKD